jgi:hypothetical protein
VQLSYDSDKEYSWPAYLTQVRAAHRCPAVLLVICPDASAAAHCRKPIAIGHPNFVLNALVVDAATTPSPSGEDTEAGPELAVLAVLTGALDLEQDSSRRLILASLASVDESRRTAYTFFVLNAASAAAHQALEDLMATTQYSDPFIDRFLAEGKAEGLAEGKAEGLAEGEARGEARMILRILAARGFQVPAEVSEHVLSCSDTAQLEAWGDRAATAASVEDVFSG